MEGFHIIDYMLVIEIAFRLEMSQCTALQGLYKLTFCLRGHEFQLHQTPERRKLSIILMKVERELQYPVHSEYININHQKNCSLQDKNFYC